MLVCLLLFFSFFGILSSTSAGDTVRIGFRDHYEITCRNDGLLDFFHVIIVTANATQNVTFSATYSYFGELASEITSKTDPEIHYHNVLGTKGSSEFQVFYNATLKPLKFTKVELDYTWDGLLKKDDKGYFNFEATFNSISPFIPEILLKIPKPSPFHKLKLAKCIPPPQVFMEETQYYILTWNSKSFEFEGTSSTHIDLKYKTILDYSEMWDWTKLVIVGVLIGWVLERIIEH